MKKIISILLAICVLLSFVGCGTQAEAPKDDAAPKADSKTEDKSGEKAAEATVGKDTLTIAATSDYGTLDVIHNGFPSDYVWAAEMYAEPLWEIVDENTKKWMLATDLEKVSETEWIITLREGVKFSNGNPFTADDVLFTFDVNCNTPGYYPYFPHLDWERCEKIDDYHVKICFSMYDRAYEGNVMSLWMLDAESYDEESYASHPIGTGPYVVTDYLINSYLKMTANENYWGEQPAIKNLEFKCMSENSQKINAIDAGEIDYAVIPLQDADYVESLEDYEIKYALTNYSACVWFNPSGASVFASADARKAVCHAIDTDTIINLVYGGHAEHTSWPHADTAPDFEERFAGMNETYSVGYNVDLAKQYVEKSGLAGKTVRIVSNGSADNSSIAEIVMQNLIDVGIDAKVLNYDQATVDALFNETDQWEIFIRDLTYDNTGGAHMYNSYIVNTPVIAPCEWLPEDIREEFFDKCNNIMGISDEKELSETMKWLTENFVEYPCWFTLCQPYEAKAVRSGLDGMYFTLVGHRFYNEWYWTK